jgi:hypothetical protein
MPVKLFSILDQRIQIAASKRYSATKMPPHKASGKLLHVF